MTVSAPVASTYQRLGSPSDSESADLDELLDAGWAWRAYCQEFGEHEFEPHEVTVVQFNHTPGRRATVLYEAEWPLDVYIPSEQFTLRKEPGEPAQIFRFPEDPDLPGLASAVFPETAHELIKGHVLALPPRRMRVDVVRYRPGNHAVLRHRMGKARFYARVMRPAAIPNLLQAAELVAGSSFVVPRIAGHWHDGGVIWTSEIPGENLRERIRAGGRPDPEVILGGLESLWAVPLQSGYDVPFNLAWRYQDAKRTIDHATHDHDGAHQAFSTAIAALDPFMQLWTPLSTAHNDFYDDQLLVLPDDRMVLVDFEEAGGGDPMLDVGNFLAHLNWGSRLGSQKRAGARAEYHGIFKDAALRRFRWDERDLDLREAICLFRLCTTPIRRPQETGLQRLEDGLALVNETIG